MPSLESARYTRPIRLGELDALAIRHPLVHATVALQGAHLVQFAPVDEADWLWLSPSARFEPERAIRGGIPVCWPWFGDPARNPAPVRECLDPDNAGAHGLARTARWTLAQLQEQDDEVAMTLILELPDSRPGPWQGQARASLSFTFRRDRLSLTLVTENTGDRPLAITQALHTYLPTDGIVGTSIHGLEGTAYLDTLDGWRRKVQQGVVGFQGETDRIYQGAPEMIIKGARPAYRLTARGSNSTVVWNPGPGKAARLSDFPDHAWTGMLCVETANAADDYRALAPGVSHSITMTLTRESGEGLSKKTGAG